MTEQSLVGKAMAATSADIVSREEITSKLVSLLADVPDFDGGDGLGMVDDILNASTWQDLQGEANGLPKAELVANRELIVTRIEKAESTIADSLTPFYLIVTSYDPAKQEVVRWQTSAATVMAKLVRLHSLNALPVIVRLSKADKPTRSGMFPMNMTVLAKD